MARYGLTAFPSGTFVTCILNHLLTLLYIASLFFFLLLLNSRRIWFFFISLQYSTIFSVFIQIFLVWHLCFWFVCKPVIFHKINGFYFIPLRGSLLFTNTQKKRVLSENVYIALGERSVYIYPNFILLGYRFYDS